MKIPLLLLLAILAFATNPGILIGVPLPYRFPLNSFIKPPLDIPNFTVMDTQFTNIQIRELEFNTSVLRYKPKTAIIKECLAVEILVNYMEAHFNFKHKGNYGPGVFMEAGMYIKVEFNLTDKDGKVHIEIERIELDQGKVKVQLGGSIQERFISIVTGIVINYAAPFFYSTIKDAVRGKVDDFNKNVDSQIDYLNIHMDLSLINNPTFNSTYLTIGLNGASFIDSRPGVLNPNDVLKPNVSQPTIQVLVHEDVLDSCLKVYLQKNSASHNISMSSITDIVDINSLTLSPVFPAMASEAPQGVILNFLINSSKVSFIPGFASVTANMVGNVYFKDSLYMNPTTGVFKLNGSLIYGEDKIAVDVDNMDVVNLNFNAADISSGKVYPEGWTTYQPTILRWLTSGFDGILFSKPQQIQEYGIKLYLNGVVKTKYMEMSVVIF